MKQEELHFQTIVFWILDLAAVLLATWIALLVFHHIPGAASEASWELSLRLAACLFYSGAFFWNIEAALPSDDTRQQISRNLLFKHLFLLFALFFFIRFTDNSGKKPLLSLFVSFFSFLFILTIRLIYRLILGRTYRKRGYGAGTILVTDKASLPEALRTFATFDTWQMALHAIVLTDASLADAEEIKDASGNEIPRIDRSSFERYLKREPVRFIVFDLPEDAMDLHQPLSAMAVKDGIAVLVRAREDASEALSHGGIYGSIGGRNFLFLNSRQQHERSLFVKRVVDIFIGLIGAAMTLLVTAIVGPIIKSNSKGPVYTATRCIGKDGERFKKYAFRTNYTGNELKKELLAPEESPASGGTSERKPRRTRAGEVVESLKIQWMPQFFSVLTGKMSFVGVTAIPEEEYLGNEHLFRTLLRVKPGMITPPDLPGQVRSKEADSTWITADAAYVENWSLWLDIVTIMDNIRARYEKKHRIYPE